MFLIRKMKRSTSLLGIALILANVLLPSFSYALTSGPTAPEATSFEPVDTTDMVNLSSGDLAYNIPLLEVPGPAGSYPLSLSYHAGIQPNEDASWVGLGWTLNPGAITRNVNGFADDFKDVTDISRFYWAGGETKTYSAGVTVGVVGTPASMSTGLSFSQDTFQGSGVGVNTTIGLGLISFSGGLDSYGNSSVNLGVSTGRSLAIIPGAAGASSLNLSGSVGLSTNFQSVQANGSGGISVAKEKEVVGADGRKRTGHINQSLLGASISTGKSGTSGTVGVGGVQLAANSRSGRISTSSSGFTLPIPTPIPGLSFSLGYNVQRYWIDETENTITNGVLHFPTSSVDKDHLDDHAYDTYSLKDPLDQTNFLNDPERSLGGTLPGYDNYNAHAQGVGGSFRPYLYQKHLLRKNKFKVLQDGNGDDYNYYQSINYNMGADSKPVEFRFINDFSSRLEYEPDPINQTSSTLNPLTFNFLGGNLTVGEDGTNGYINGDLPGSRNITWLTNAEILNPTSPKRIQSGFMENNATGFDRTSLNPDLIGGFVITNESGVKYHFTLPAMSSKEYFYSQNTEEVLTFNEFKKNEPYAYTWYLTGITGPDYVDRGASGADGVFGKDDWGYWVEFEYGKWTDQYAWRNPGAGMDVDLDSKFENFSEGVKELYYLDAIRTATHTALFIKDIRNDAKSSLHFIRNVNQERETIDPLGKVGGYLPKNTTCSCTSGTLTESLNYTARPTSTLQLSKVVLIDNREIANFNVSKSAGSEFGFSFNSDWSLNLCNLPSASSNPHLFQNVLDVHDEVSYFSSLTTKALRVIHLDTDYSLSPETPNSYETSLVQVQNPSENAADYPLDGKLTLKGVRFLGKGGADFIPGLTFNYDLEDPITGGGSLVQESGEKRFSFTLGNSNFAPGDLLKAAGNIYAVITEVAGSKHTIRIIGSQMPAAGNNYTWQTTKNPPYNEDFYDIWGYYKSDFIPLFNENLQRFPTVVSSKSVDAWSLRSVGTSLGSTIKIDYESDSYSSSVFLKNFSIPLSFNSEAVFDPEEPDQQTERVAVLAGTVSPETDIKFNQLYNVGETVDLIALYGICSGVQGGTINCNYVPVSNGVVKSVSAHAIKIEAFTYTAPDWPNDDHRFYQGQLYFGSNVLNQGGGIRVKSVGIESGLLSKENQTQYEYLNGVTSYEPVKMDQYALGTSDEKAQAAYAYYVNLPISNLVALGNFVPPPGIMYKNVIVREAVIQDGTERLIPNHSEYEFNVFNEDMVQLVRGAPTFTPVNPPQNFGGYVDYDRIQTRNITIKDYTTQLGSLKRITLYDALGNKMSETLNHYAHDDQETYDEVLAGYNNQGVIEETFAEAMFARRYHLTFGEQEDFSLNGMITKKEEYPSIQVGQTNINYKTGITSTSTNLAYDYFSGQVTKTLSSDGYGNSYLSETIPAYRKYEEMGQGAYGNKNMLTQEAGNSTFKVDALDPSTRLGLVSATAQTWSKDLPVLGAGNQSSQKIYRKHSSFSWIGNNVPLAADGLYPVPNFTEFSGWTSGSSGNQWQKNGEITLYDTYSHALEAKDINGNYAATKMSSDQVQVLASLANAAYDEFAYSGAEDEAEPLNGFYGGQVKKGEGVEVFQVNADDRTTTHTGKKALQLNASGSKAFDFSALGKANRLYRASVWTNSTNGKLKYSLNGVTNATEATTAENKKAGAWYLINLDIPIGPQNQTLRVWCETGGGVASFDDFRLHPINAPMTSYVYNEWGELSHILDNNNLYTEYQYDEMGRLTRTFKETIHQSAFWGASYGAQGIAKVSEIEYNYRENDPDNDFFVLINSSSTGNTGSIAPSGATSVPQNSNLVFELIEDCATPNLSKVFIDNAEITLSQSTVTLYDGTTVSANGNQVTFGNVQSDHSIRAQFLDGFPSAGVICSKIEVDIGGGSIVLCPTGFYDYFRRDACGVETWVYSRNSSQIPSDLQHLIPDNCCDNAPTTCNCEVPEQ